jgi:hypothetical protein
MTAFDYDNLPENLGSAAALPGGLFEKAHAALTEAMTSRHVVAAEARAAYVYERKGNLDFDVMGQDRNPTYGRQDDDIVLQLTIRLRSRDGLGRLEELEHNANDAGFKAEQERLEAELAEGEASENKTQELARETRERLDALRSKSQG